MVIKIKGLLTSFYYYLIIVYNVLIKYVIIKAVYYFV